MLSSPPAEWAALALPSDQLLEFRSSLIDSLASPSTSSAAALDRRVELLCEIPSWSADCFDDLASCQDLRRRTLAALHGIVDDLRSRGLSPKYRLLTSSIGFASIRLSSPSSSTSPSASALDLSAAPFELDGDVSRRSSSARGGPFPARRNSDVLREALDKLDGGWLAERREQTFVLPRSESLSGPTLVMT